MHFQSHPHFLTWIPPAVGCLFAKLTAAGFAKLAARRRRALESVAPPCCHLQINLHTLKKNYCCCCW
jgi:hypothetical protein